MCRAMLVPVLCPLCSGFSAVRLFDASHNRERVAHCLCAASSGGWIFGDGWEFGLYDGQNFVEKYGVILVAPNYR
jgi:hypothetical protein